MAIPINVPLQQRAAIAELASLKDEAYQALWECLSQTESTLSEASVLVERTSKAVASQTRLGGQIVGMLIGLRSLVDQSAAPVGAIAAGVANDVETRKWISKDSNETLRGRLSALLEMKAVTVSAKAFSLAVGDESPFQDVRIFSDIRAIFSGGDRDLEFSGSIIVHHMAIEVGSSRDDQHCAMTISDLLKLKRTVERAIEKDKKLRNALRGGPIAPLEVEPTSMETES